MKTYNSIFDTVGKTPLLLAERFASAAGANAKIIAKLEYMNPTGSVKDRAALYMINDAEASGRLCHGGVIIEPTSGNTGIALSAIAAARGYRSIIVMPDSMSSERMALIRSYGAEVELTEGKCGMAGAIKRAEELAKEIPGSFIPSQFSNPANARAHYETTGPEIWRDTDGKVDVFIAGVGTGGTISGVGRYLKEKNPNIKIVAVEPKDSPVLSGGAAGSHGIQGIGAGFVPDTLERSLLDKVICVTKEEAYGAARLFAKSECVLVGISSGAALFAASELARRKENSAKHIVALLPDGGERYLSTDLFS